MKTSVVQSCFALGVCGGIIMLVIFGMVLELSIFHLWLARHGFTTLQYVEQQRVHAQTLARRNSTQIGRSDSQKIVSEAQELENRSIATENKSTTILAIEQNLALNTGGNTISSPNPEKDKGGCAWSCKCCCCCKESRQSVFAIKE